jgi:hypothetical protein
MCQAGLEEIKSEAELEEEAELKAMEDVLEGLGPRWVNWTGNRPVPIDGDLLLSPDAVCKRPFRLLPYGVKPKLTDFELTDLRRFARPLPPHFVLGIFSSLSPLNSPSEQCVQAFPLIVSHVFCGGVNLSSQGSLPTFCSGRVL